MAPISGPTHKPQAARLIVGLSGASGVIFGVRLLELLRDTVIETHLVMSRSAEVTLAYETNHKVKDVKALADRCYDIDDMAAPISSGSYLTLGMIVAPCSVKSLAEIASGVTTTLLSRAADVTLKERRPLLLMVRETPFNLAHLRNMAAVTEMGGIVFPPLPAFYHRPASIAEMVDDTVERALALLGVAGASAREWRGL
jgi:4-hydroxy-3-polyprenylbenzoate decarboxylase